jgi:hypothetical protein
MTDEGLAMADFSARVTTSLAMKSLRVLLALTMA